MMNKRYRADFTKLILDKAFAKRRYWIMKKWVSLLLGLLLLLAGCGGNGPEEAAGDEPGRQAASKIEVLGGEEDTLREFIQRYVGQGYYGMVEGDTRILIGSLPETLPFNLPLPEDTQVVGSVIREGPTESIEIIMDVDGTPEEAIAFFSDGFSGRKWKVIEEPGAGGGFISFEFMGITYCYNKDEAFLTLNARELDARKTDVRVYIQHPLDPYANCAQLDYGAGPGAPYDLIPPLVAPKGAIQRVGGGGGSGMNDQYISTTLETDLNAKALLDHYNLQLEEAGWESVSEVNVGGAAWSHWLMKDDQGRAWDGMLLIIESASNTEGRFALLQIERQP
jgi:hypothetical protein